MNVRHRKTPRFWTSVDFDLCVINQHAAGISYSRSQFGLIRLPFWKSGLICRPDGEAACSWGSATRRTREGGARPYPVGERRFACPNPAGSKMENGEEESLPPIAVVPFCRTAISNGHTAAVSCIREEPAASAKWPAGWAVMDILCMCEGKAPGS